MRDLKFGDKVRLTDARWGEIPPEFQVRFTSREGVIVGTEYSPYTADNIAYQVVGIRTRMTTWHKESLSLVPSEPFSLESYL